MNGTVTTTGIVSFRRLLADLVSARCSPPTYLFLPEDVAHLPCLVVGRPSLRESNEPSLMTLSADIVLLGRRMGDDDAQAELDALGDELFLALGGTRSVRVDDSHLHCTLILPGTVTVAGLECPAYIATVSMETLTC